MKLGAYTACLHDKTLDEALEILRDLGLTSAEVNAGGFIGTPHLPVEQLLESRPPARTTSPCSTSTASNSRPSTATATRSTPTPRSPTATT